MSTQDKEIPDTPRQRVGMKLARAMCPEDWAEYDAGNGVCTNQAGWKIKESIVYAGRLMKAFPQIVEALNEPAGTE